MYHGASRRITAAGAALSPVPLRVFSRGHATLHLAMSVGPSVRRSVRHISELRAVFALLPLPNRPRLSCRVSGLVRFEERQEKRKRKKKRNRVIKTVPE